MKKKSARYIPNAVTTICVFNFNDQQIKSKMKFWKFPPLFITHDKLLANGGHHTRRRAPWCGVRREIVIAVAATAAAAALPRL